MSTTATEEEMSQSQNNKIKELEDEVNRLNALCDHQSMEINDRALQLSQLNRENTRLQNQNKELYSMIPQNSERTFALLRKEIDLLRKRFDNEARTIIELLRGYTE